MTIIFGTNILVDSFKILSTFPLHNYIYFLTHMHADHYQGMKSNWNFGPIYCTEVTKILLLNKFHHVEGIVYFILKIKVKALKKTLDLNCPTIIYLNQSKSISVEVTLFDANHCPGSVMILFRGYMGTILHTGDMRFDPNIFYKNLILYPKFLRNENLEKMSLHIDELVFDNTFCDPIFEFGSQAEAMVEMKKIIDENRDCRILIALDSLGKEVLLIELAEYYKTLIVVNNERFKNIKSINMRPELFTTNKDEGWIEVIKKQERTHRLFNEEEKCICIIATGWGNGKERLQPDPKTYIVSYSLHSNFREIESFVKSISPSILTCVVRKNNDEKKWMKIQEFSNYLICLQRYQQKGYELLKEKYAKEDNLSQEYKNLLNPEIQKNLNLELGISLSEKHEELLNTLQFENKNKQVFLARKSNRNKGFKIKPPEDNEYLNEQDIHLIKNGVDLMELADEPINIENFLDLSTLSSFPLEDCIEYNRIKKNERLEKKNVLTTQINSIFKHFGYSKLVFESEDFLNELKEQFCV